MLHTEDDVKYNFYPYNATSPPWGGVTTFNFKGMTVMFGVSVYSFMCTVFASFRARPPPLATPAGCIRVSVYSFHVHGVLCVGREEQI
jgi:hypothetical protein